MCAGVAGVAGVARIQELRVPKDAEMQPCPSQGYYGSSATVVRNKGGGCQVDKRGEDGRDGEGKDLWEGICEPV